MTKRELCERLMEIRDQSSAGHLGPVGIRNTLRELLLDLAAPETEEEKEAALKERRRAVFGDIAATGKKEPEKEEKHPGIIAKPGKDGEIEWCWCQKCYAQASVVHNPFGDGENWSYCQKCGVSFRLKRVEDTK